MMTFIKPTLLFMACLILSCCTTRDGLAPVTDLRGNSSYHHGKQHTVVRGETLYAISFHYDEDYLRLARMNHLRPPYTLRVGQIIHLEPQSVAAPRRVKTQVIAAPYHQSLAKGWIWPVSGRVKTTYNPQQGKKGIDIIGQKGAKIHACASGVVAYAGNGLTGYGNLIIIKHANQYLTAYGNNSKILVKEGQNIKAGQIIAEIGHINRRDWGVHFEIRKSGEPVNPLNYFH